MKNFKFNIENISKSGKKSLKKGMALLGTAMCIASFSSCIEEVETPSFESQVSANLEVERQAIIRKVGSEGIKKGLSKDEINLEIYRLFDKKHLLTQDEAINYKKLLEKITTEESSTLYSYVR